jgi:hypothetical protein
MRVFTFAMYSGREELAIHSCALMRKYSCDLRRKGVSYATSYTSRLSRTFTDLHDALVAFGSSGSWSGTVYVPRFASTRSLILSKSTALVMPIV